MGTEFLNQVLSEMEGEPRFNPRALYNGYGDCLVFHASPEEGYADRIDHVLTLYRSTETDQAIGFQVKDVQGIVREYGYDGMAITAVTEESSIVEVSISLILVAAARKDAGGADDKRKVRAYAEATAIAGRETVQVPLKNAA